MDCDPALVDALVIDGGALGGALSWAARSPDGRDGSGVLLVLALVVPLGLAIGWILEARPGRL